MHRQVNTFTCIEFYFAFKDVILYYFQQGVHFLFVQRHKKQIIIVSNNWQVVYTGSISFMSLSVHEYLYKLAIHLSYRIDMYLNFLSYLQ